MKKTLHILFITTFVCSAFLDGMENQTLSTQAQSFPQEIIALIAGYCLPKTKNQLMRVCKDFCVCLKDRKLIIKKNPSTVSLRDKQEDMFVFTYVNDTSMMQLLLENGVRANIKNILGMTAFHVASDNKNEKAMQLLVNHGADINKPKPSIHPLHEATYKGDEATVKTWLKQKIDPNIALTNDIGITPLYIALAKRHTDIVGLLLKEDRIDVNMTYGYECTLFGCKSTLLFLTSSKGYTEMVKLLLSAKDIQVDKGHTYGDTPLWIATYNGHSKIVQLLIDAGANINHADWHGWTPLCLACCYGHIEIVTLLINNGADMHAKLSADFKDDPRIKAGDTALEIADKKGHIDIVELLQEHLKQENEQRACKMQ